METQSAIDRVRAVQAELGRALAVGDLEHAMSLMTDDVTFQASAGPPIVGRDAARQVFVTLRNFDVTISQADCNIDVVGDTALVVGRQTATLTLGRFGRKVTFSGPVIGVYRIDAGSWKLARALNLMSVIRSGGGTPVFKLESELLRLARVERRRPVVPDVH